MGIQMFPEENVYLVNVVLMWILPSRDIVCDNIRDKMMMMMIIPLITLLIGDHRTGQCRCEANVTGWKCDQCAEDFWGDKISS